MKKILVISFYESTKFQLKGYKDDSRFDIYHLPKEENKVIGSIESLEKLNINLDNYFSVITWADGLNETLEHFFLKCVQNRLIILSGQHGLNKSILQIYTYTPNIYTNYWNCSGKYMYDRFYKVIKYPPSFSNWVPLGNLSHQYLFNNFKWEQCRSNGKVLIIHEPNLQFAEGDKFPHDSESIIDNLINYFNEINIEVDLKVHPNWKNGIGNNGAKLKTFKCKYVDFEVEEIVKYSLVIGSRSSVLYDSYLMGVPVFSIESFSDWKDDEVFYTKLKIIKSYSLNDLKTAFQQNYNKPTEINYKHVQYISGNLDEDLSFSIFNFLQKEAKNISHLSIFEHSIYTSYKIIIKKINRYFKQLYLKYYLNRN